MFDAKQDPAAKILEDGDSTRGKAGLFNAVQIFFICEDVVEAESAVP